MSETLFEWPGASRTTDPQGSHEAERSITQSGARRGQMAEVERRLTLRPGATAGELAGLWDVPGLRPKHLDRVQVARRLDDLRKLGYARIGEDRKCTVSRRLQQTWWSTTPSRRT